MNIFHTSYFTFFLVILVSQPKADWQVNAKTGGSTELRVGFNFAGYSLPAYVLLEKCIIADQPKFPLIGHPDGCGLVPFAHKSFGNDTFISAPLSKHQLKKYLFRRMVQIRYSSKYCAIRAEEPRCSRDDSWWPLNDTLVCSSSLWDPSRFCPSK